MEEAGTILCVKHFIPGAIIFPKGAVPVRAVVRLYGAHLYIRFRRIQLNNGNDGPATLIKLSINTLIQFEGHHMFVQLTHLNPKQGCYDDVLSQLKIWGIAEKDSQSEAEYSFISHSDNHIFVVSVYQDKSDYVAAVAAQKKHMAELEPYLIEDHGPTYYGDILQLFDKNNPNGDKSLIPHGIYMGQDL